METIGTLAACIAVFAMAAPMDGDPVKLSNIQSIIRAIRAQVPADRKKEFDELNRKTEEWLFEHEPGQLSDVGRMERFWETWHETCVGVATRALSAGE